MAGENTYTEYYEVTVKSEEVVGYNQKKGEDILKKRSETTLVHAGSPQEASAKVEKLWKDSTWSWRIASVKESKITDVIN
jgi:hypothetical protein